MGRDIGTPYNGCNSDKCVFLSFDLKGLRVSSNADCEESIRKQNISLSAVSFYLKVCVHRRERENREKKSRNNRVRESRVVKVILFYHMHGIFTHRCMTGVKTRDRGTERGRKSLVRSYLFPTFVHILRAFILSHSRRNLRNIPR